MTKKITSLVLITFVIRVAAIFILGRHINPEVWEYDAIALNILSGKGYVYGHFNTNCYLYGPAILYSYFEALIHFLTNRNYLIMELIQAVIAALSVIPLFYLAKRIFNEKTAIISALLYCLHPGLVVYAGKIHELFLVTFFILVILYLLIRFENKAWSMVLVGLLMGLGILLRATLICIIPSYFFYLILKKRGLKKAILSVLTIALLAAIVISPWIYRGYKLYNRFIFISTTPAEQLWRGNNPRASGGTLTVDNKAIFDVAEPDFRDRILSMNEIEQYDLFIAEAKKYIKENPVRFLKNTAKKFVYFWSFSPQTGLLYPAWWLLIYKLLYVVLAFFFALGVYSIFANKKVIDIPIIVFLFSFFLMVSCIHSVFFVDMRHRWMLEPLLMIISAYGMQTFFQRAVKAKKI